MSLTLSVQTLVTWIWQNNSKYSERSVTIPNAPEYTYTHGLHNHRPHIRTVAISLRNNPN